MESGNWIIDNLLYALKVWNEKLAEIWTLLTQSPQSFKGGTIWSVIVSINGALKAIGTALLVLFFLVGVVKTAGSISEVKRPEHALKLFVRFAIAKGVITYGLDLMSAIFKIVQGVINTSMHTAHLGTVIEIRIHVELLLLAGHHCFLALHGKPCNSTAGGFYPLHKGTAATRAGLIGSCCFSALQYDGDKSAAVIPECRNAEADKGRVNHGCVVTYDAGAAVHPSAAFAVPLVHPAEH